MKKTLLITLEYPPQIGGIASYVYNLALHLPSEQAVVCAPKQKGDTEFDQKNPWKTYRVRPFCALFWPRWVRLLWHVWRIVRKEKIEQLYIHHTLPVGYVAKIIKQLFKINYTLFIHGTDLHVGTRNWWKRRQFRKVCLSAETIIVNSEFLKNKLLAKFEQLSNVIVLNPCPSDIFLTSQPHDKLSHLRSQLAVGGKRVMVAVGRLVDGKGYPHLINALSEIVAQVPNALLLLIGDGPKRDELMRMVQKNNLQNSVRFLGNVPHTELSAYYQISDLFVLLTHPDENTEEGWGTAFLEAAASGLPAVAGRAGGVEEAVENLVTGIVVDVAKPELIIKNIVELLKNIDYTHQLGMAARERVMREFRWDKQVAKLL